ncbi:MAG: OmpA family protein, partial [Bacteroidota bacterium]
CSLLTAQSPTRPNALIFKRIVTDYNIPMTGDLMSFENYRGGFEIDYLRNISRRLNAVIPAKVSVINLPGEDENRTTVSIDGLVQLQYFEYKNRLIPYGLLGAGAVFEENADMNLQIPIGVGLNIRLGNYAYINLQTEFRKSLSPDRDNIQHGIGFGLMVGKVSEDIDTTQLLVGTDYDGDGISNDKDACPELPGPAAFQGCPDTDADGIADNEDDCPELAGISQLGGCPDTDEDGLSDPQDECPEEAGPAANNGCPIADRDGDGFEDLEDDCPAQPGTVRGCPDTDGDGTPDSEDRCPRSPGPLNAQGCPDTDQDGLDDGKDRCPNMAGDASNNGCPEIKQEDRATLEYAIQAVQFETGKEQLKTESYAILNRVADILNRYPDYRLIISGHTDDVGTEENNLVLSERRAKACYDYLSERGIPTERLSYAGYGESNPIAENTDATGRQLNRRVEFDLVPR